MVKLVCYGVRETEVPYFHEINKKFGYDIKLVTLGLNHENVKDIIRGLTVEDCFAGPEEDRNPKYDGWIFKFNPMFEDTQLYIKIRIENIEKSVCLSVHEFGKYDEVS